MSDFSNNRSGRDRGQRRFGGGSRFSGGRSGGGSRFGGGDRMMHKAICANCGKECEVPFRPSGDRPVYCSDCFEKRERYGEGDRRGGDRRDFGRPRFDDRRPARPPTFDRGNSGNQQNSQIMDQLRSLNIKLDKIINSLEPKKLEVPQFESKVIESIVAEPKAGLSKTESKSKKAKSTKKKTGKEIIKSLSPIGEIS